MIRNKVICFTDAEHKKGTYAPAQALAAGWRLNGARMGNLSQPPCQGSSAVNEFCYILVNILQLQ